MNSNSQYSNWPGWVPAADGHQVQEEDGQGRYYPYYQSAPRGDTVDDLTLALENTTVHDDPHQVQGGFGDQYGQYTGGNYCPSPADEAGGLVSTSEEGRRQSYIPTAPSYNQDPPSGSQKGNKGSRNNKKGPGDRNKGNNKTSSSKQRPNVQQGQNPMYGSDDPFYPPSGQSIADPGVVEEPSQEEPAYHGYLQASSGAPSDQQNSTAFVGGYGYGQKPYSDDYRSPRQAKPSKKSAGKQRETAQQWGGNGFSTVTYGHSLGHTSDLHDPTGQDESYSNELDESPDDGFGTGDVDTLSDPSAVPYSEPYPGSEDDVNDDGVKTPTRTSPGLQPSTVEYQEDEFNGYYPALPEPAFATEETSMSGPGKNLDDRYVIENSSRFAPGEVFKTLWSEPLGSTRNENMTDVQVKDHMGQKFYVGVRRFVVVANDEGNCTCVRPILTYERRGCTKKGVKAEKHGIVYPSTGRPVLLPKEPQLGFKAVRLKLDHPTEKLAKESRINYAKLTTIEHNIRVLFIGRIVREDFNNIVGYAVNKCWADKIHRPSDKSSKQGGGNRRR